MAVPRIKRSSTNDRKDPYAKFNFGELGQRPNGIEETFAEIKQLSEQAKNKKPLMSEQEWKLFCKMRRENNKL